jgi:hypothetical protein
MIIWTTKKKASEDESEAEEGKEDSIKTPRDIEECVEPVISRYQCIVEEALANGLFAYTAYLNHKTPHLFESGIKNSFLSPFKHAVRKVKRPGDIYPAIVDVTTIDLERMQTESFPFTCYLGELQNMLRDEVELEIEYIGTTTHLATVTISLKK